MRDRKKRKRSDAGNVVTKPLAEVNKRAIEEGLLIIQAQGNVIRFVPPLIVEEKHIDEMIEKLKRALARRKQKKKPKELPEVKGRIKTGCRTYYLDLAKDKKEVWEDGRFFNCTLSGALMSVQGILIRR